MATLYELKEQYLMLKDFMLDDEADPQLIQDTMECLEGEIADKLEAYKIIDTELEAEEEKLKREIDRLSLNKARILKNREKLKNKMTDMVSELPDQKIDSEHYKFKMVKNGGYAPLIFDELKPVPEEYYKVIREVDNNKIRECLAHGELDFVKLGERAQHLSIK